MHAAGAGAALHVDAVLAGVEVEHRGLADAEVALVQEDDRGGVVDLDLEGAAAALVELGADLLGQLGGLGAVLGAADLAIGERARELGHDRGGVLGVAQALVRQGEAEVGAQGLVAQRLVLGQRGRARAQHLEGTPELGGGDLELALEEAAIAVIDEAGGLGQLGRIEGVAGARHLGLDELGHVVAGQEALGGQLAEQRGQELVGVARALAGVGLQHDGAALGQGGAGG